MDTINLTSANESDLHEAGFYWRAKNGVLGLVCSALEADGFSNGFSTRLGGVSQFPNNALNLAGFNEDVAANIDENRRRFLSLFPGPWKLATVWQVHGADLRIVADEHDDCRDQDQCDAVACRTSGIMLAVKTADCVPVLLADQKSGAFAAVHAGWRGTVAEIVTRTVVRMQKEFGTLASDLRAAIGPAAQKCCYEVGADVIEPFRARFGALDHLLEPTRAGHALIDLQSANREQLLNAGLHPQRIHIAPLCTMCRNDLFFSYRKEKVQFGKTGRLFSAIGKV